MKKFEILSITLLLAFMALLFLSVADSTTKSSAPQNSKAFLASDEGDVKPDWKDHDKKLYVHFLFSVLFGVFILCSLLPNSLENRRKKLHFIHPIFYQGNYLISPSPFVP